MYLEIILLLRQHGFFPFRGLQLYTLHKSDISVYTVFFHFLGNMKVKNSILKITEMVSRNKDNITINLVLLLPFSTRNWIQYGVRPFNGSNEKCETLSDVMFRAFKFTMKL
jgi:hypothetical protein